MTTTIDINQVQVQISQLIELARDGQEIILAQNDKPLLRVMAIEAPRPRPNNASAVCIAA